MSDVPMQYVVARVRDALAHDTRVAALDLQVRIVGSDLFLTGMVSSEPVGTRRRPSCAPRYPGSPCTTSWT